MPDSNFRDNSIFWIEVEKIDPNPYQPRNNFDDNRLQDLADSIRQYGVLQPLVVTRRETLKDDGGLLVSYELIAGERRLRASKIAGITQVPAIIRSGNDDARVKLELAIIENLQREDLNPVDRAKAFYRLGTEFGFKHSEIGKKVGKSREYVSNTLRLLSLPQEMLDAMVRGEIYEGHTRPLLMLADRPDQQRTLFREIVYKKMNVREAEGIARRIAVDRARKRESASNPEMIELESKLSESLGTRVQIEERERGGKITIDFFSKGDLDHILALIKSNQVRSPTEMMDRFIESLNQNGEKTPSPETPSKEEAPQDGTQPEPEKKTEEQNEDDSDLYSVKNFSI